MADGTLVLEALGVTEALGLTAYRAAEAPGLNVLADGVNPLAIHTVMPLRIDPAGAVLTLTPTSGLQHPAPGLSTRLCPACRWRSAPLRAG